MLRLEKVRRISTQHKLHKAVGISSNVDLVTLVRVSVSNIYMYSFQTMANC